MNSRRDLIAIVIPCFNHYRFTRNAIQTLLAAISQDTKHEYAILLFDNHSTDQTRRFARQQRRIKNFFYYRYPKNYGVTRAWNDGARIALESLGAAQVFFANNDIIIPRLALKRLTQTLSTALGPSLVGPTTNGPGIHSQQHVTRFYPDYHPSNRVSVINRFQNGLGVKTALDWPEVNGFFFGVNASALRLCETKDSNSHETIYFDPKNSILHNEVEFQKRLKSRGGKILLASDAFIFHYKGVTRGLFNPARTRSLWERIQRKVALAVNDWKLGNLWPSLRMDQTGLREADAVIRATSANANSRLLHIGSDQAPLSLGWARRLGPGAKSVHWSPQIAVVDDPFDVICVSDSSQISAEFITREIPQRLKSDGRLILMPNSLKPAQSIAQVTAELESKGIVKICEFKWNKNQTLIGFEIQSTESI